MQQLKWPKIIAETEVIVGYEARIQCSLIFYGDSSYNDKDEIFIILSGVIDYYNMEYFFWRLKRSSFLFENHFWRVHRNQVCHGW